MKIKITRPVLIEASIQEFADDDVRQEIGEDAYQKVKSQDQHPLFVKLDVGKQGVSTGKTIVDGIRKFVQKIWSATRIKEMANWLNHGIPLFVGHGTTNSTNNRMEVGKTLKGWAEEMSDGLHAFAVAWIPSWRAEVQESVRGGDIDVCSIEASLLFSLGKLGKMFVDKITSLTAVALGSKSKGQIPGFATAGVVAQVQEMADLKTVIDEALRKEGIKPEDVEIEIEDGDDKDNKDGDSGGSNKKKVKGSVRKRRKKLEDLTLGEIQIWIKNHNVSPAQLYSAEDLLNVKSISDAMQAEVSERVEEVEGQKQTEIDKLTNELTEAKDATKQKEDELKKIQDDLKGKEDLIKQQNEELTPYKTQQRRDKIVQMVLSNDKLKDVSQEKAKYIADHITVEDDVDLKGEEVGGTLNKAIDTQLEDIEKSGITFTGKKDGDGNDNKGGEGGGEGGGSDKGKYDNPFIPKKKEG